MRFTLFYCILSYVLQSNIIKSNVCIKGSELNHVKPNIGHDSFLRVSIHPSAEHKVDGKYIILRYEPMREQNGFHVTRISPISQSEHRKYIYTKFIGATAYSLWKQVVMSASECSEIAYHDDGIIQLTSVVFSFSFWMMHKHLLIT